MQPTIYFSADHPIDIDLVDPDALQVIHRLQQAGFTAYLVGGGVRDLLMGHTPKDYDISTSARPEEIKRLFGRQCILIGRRFRLAHIRFGHKIIEVSTFRSGEMSEDLIKVDNVFGSEQDDVMRRDFTINGLYYDPEHHKVIDYVGGREDLHEHVLNTIGDPEVRFKQDPVRMIRLLKFQARFNFKSSEPVSLALAKCLPEIIKSSPARVLEEILRMLESTASKKFFHLLIQTGMVEWIFPKLSTILRGPKGELILSYLDAVDKINCQSRKFPIERPVLTAALLFPILDEKVHEHFFNLKLAPNFGDILHQTHQVIAENLIQAFSHFPRRISSIAAYVMSTQYRLTLKTKKVTPRRLFKLKEFPLALRLLKIRAFVQPELQQTYIYWREHYRQFLRDEDRPHKKTHPKKEPSHATPNHS